MHFYYDPHGSTTRFELAEPCRVTIRVSPDIRSEILHGSTTSLAKSEETGRMRTRTPNYSRYA